jgi:hypothetical protein
MRKSNRGDRMCASLSRVARSISALIAAVAVFAMLNPSAAADGPTSEGESTESHADADGKRPLEPELIRGKVVWLAAALKREFGISTVPEVAENSLAILTKDGQLVPIVENLRGRAFRTDERLREMEVEILARRHRRQPLIQILRLYQVEDDQRYEIDYWCDVCAIVMYETGPCACCQDDNRLRKRLVQPEDLLGNSIE